jgi:uncharacterized protein YndB with AHSA1/START domain
MTHVDAEPRPLTASTEIAATPDVVWKVVSDVRRTGEWSPECRRVVPIGRLGRSAFLLGYNRRGSVRWATVSRITTYRPEQEIEWAVLTNRSRWSYRLVPTAVGTTLHQTRRTPRGEGRFAVWFTCRFLGGQAAHDDELEEGMRAGLERIKAIVESTAHDRRA